MTLSKGSAQTRRGSVKYLNHAACEYQSTYGTKRLLYLSSHHWNVFSKNGSEHKNNIEQHQQDLPVTQAEWSRHGKQIL